jgi:predicted AlkP superfamily pyrophosphatase or phosphodiesterase
MRLLRILLTAAAALAAAFAQTAPAQRAVLLVSVDGLRPDYVTQADQHKLKIPFLRRMLREGAFADGVKGVLPSVTYSSHTTLLTGTMPARHGIVFNHPFTPIGHNPDAWYWYREDIRVPTLWDLASGAGYKVASISWPVSVGAAAITYNLPEFAGTRSPEDLKMIRALAQPGLMAELEKVAGPYLTDVARAIPRDWARTRYAVEIIRRKHARFVTVHLAALDHMQHESGPFSAEATATLEEIDRMLSMLADAIRAEDRGAAISIVSDHGFAPVEKTLKLDAAFVKEGLIVLKTPRESLVTSVISDWTAMPWSCSGSAAILLKDPKDSSVREKVRKLLVELQADPANGIAAILDGPAVARLGGTRTATFWVDLRPGFSISPALSGPIVASVSRRGTHGYSPEHPEMASFFAISGAGIHARSLGTIDMRSIAPTIAEIMKLRMTTAEVPALPLQ